MLNPYLWIVVAGGVVSFLTGAGVGMNDLGNAFGTTYGARILTVMQIVLLASVCEMAGAISLGGEVTSTISSGIANPSDFASHPYIFMYGMLCACTAAFLWLALATWLSLPVSSTHSICGGVIGFAMVYGGGGSVNWATPKKDFPFIGGVTPIVCSWFISPSLSGLAAAAIYGIIRRVVLQPTHSLQRALYCLPVIIGSTFFLEAFFVLFKGAQKRLHWGVGKAAWVAALIGIGAGLLTLLLLPLLKRRVEHDLAEAEAREQRRHDEARVDVSGPNAQPSESESNAAREPVCERSAAQPAASAAVLPETFVDPFRTAKTVEAAGDLTGTVVENSEDDTSSTSSEDRRAHMTAMEEVDCITSEEYPKHAERVFRYLQIFTAICASFAHGANDVSNAVGPFAAIYSVYLEKKVFTSVETPIWILMLGGAGIVVGLASFGVRIMRLLGERITRITPSRGFSAELATALVVSFASGYGIPISSTHCITGAVVSISIVDLGVRNVKWGLVLRMYGGWMVTLVITAVTSALLFSQGVYAPSF